MMRILIGLALLAGTAAPSLAAQPEPAPPQASAPGWTANGRLEDSDAQDEGRRYDEHRVTLEAGRRYRMTAASSDFDTILRLSLGDQRLTENDDYGEGVDSRIEFAARTSGEHVLRVLGYSAEARGAYTVTLEAIAPLPPVIAARPTRGPRSRWWMWEGELTASDPEVEGSHFDDYPIRMRAGETRIISLESASADVVVSVLRAGEREGEPIDSNDDGGVGFNALLAFQADADGDYLIRAVGFGSDSLGPYRLRISEPLIPPVSPADEPSEASAD